MSGPTPEQIERFFLTIGDYNRHNLRGQILKNGAEIAVSNGVSFMGYRLTTEEMRRFGQWLLNRAADIEADA